MSKPSHDPRRTHQPQPLYLALVTFADAQRHAARAGHDRWQAANAAFVQARQALHTDAWDDVRARHEHAATAVATGAADTAQQEHTAALEDYAAAHRAFQSGAAVKEPEEALYARFYAEVADIAETTRDQLAIDQRALIAAAQEAFATLDADAPDAEVVALLQHTLATLRPVPKTPAPKDAAADAAPPPSPNSPAKPPRAAKAAEDDHG